MTRESFIKKNKLYIAAMRLQIKVRSESLGEKRLNCISDISFRTRWIYSEAAASILAGLFFGSERKVS